MGQTTSQEHKLYIQVLQRILKEQGFKVALVKLASLLMWVKAHCTWFPVTGTFDSQIWSKVGEELQTKKLLQFEVLEELIVTWRKVYTTLKTLQAVEAVLTSKMENEKDDDNIHDDVPSPSDSDFDPLGPGPTEPEKEPDLYPPLTPVKSMAAAAPMAASLLQPKQASF